jgi:hypothetical protein
MANVDAPFGFRPVGELGSNIQNGGTTKYRIEDNQTGAIYKGDPVFVGDGSDAGAAVTPSAGYIASAAATNICCIGIFNGCYYIDPTSGKPTWSNYYPGAINITEGTIDAYVYDDPSKLFVVQASGTLTYASAVNNNIDIATYAAGSTINGQSNVELAASVTASGATAQFVIMGLTGDPANNDASSANSNWIVKFNEHRYYNTGAHTF